MIIDSATILQSETSKGDATYGDGTYLTSLPPETDQKDLAYNNYDDGKCNKITVLCHPM